MQHNKDCLAGGSVVLHQHSFILAPVYEGLSDRCGANRDGSQLRVCSMGQYALSTEGVPGIICSRRHPNDIAQR
jgi:hypothetical protein